MNNKRVITNYSNLYFTFRIIFPGIDDDNELIPNIDDEKTDFDSEEETDDEVEDLIIPKKKV